MLIDHLKEVEVRCSRHVAREELGAALLKVLLKLREVGLRGPVEVAHPVVLRRRAALVAGGCGRMRQATKSVSSDSERCCGVCVQA